MAEQGKDASQSNGSLEDSYDLDQMMVRLRLAIHQRRQAANGALTPKPAAQIGEPIATPLRGTGLMPESALARPAVESAGALAELERSWHITGAEFITHRKLLGKPLLFIRRFVRELLIPLFQRQEAFNSANRHLVAGLCEEVAALRAELSQSRAALERTLSAQEHETKAQLQMQARRFSQLFDGELKAHSQALSAFKSELERSLGQIDESVRRLAVLEEHSGETHRKLDQLNELAPLRMQCATIAERLARVERRLRHAVQAGQVGQAGEIGQAAPAASSAPPNAAREGTEFDYAGFEDRFHGSESVIEQKLSKYVALFAGHGPVLDVGCGRGEFLELLREAGVEAAGVDIDRDAATLCVEKGLTVRCADAFEYLAAQPDHSLGGVFSAQVLEHLGMAQVAALVELAFAKLRQGGVMVLETLNPESLFVLYRWFPIDPTHVRLIHPETLRFLCEAVGFGEVTCRFAPPPEGPLRMPPLSTGAGAELEQFNRATQYLNSVLFSSEEYAVLATR